MILKNKRSLKLFMCLILSCSLCVSAPLARYQRIESHAAVAVPIAIGAATIALMYLASCGISYVFQGMAQEDAEDWIDTKIIEFSSLSDGDGGTNGNMPNGSGNWKMTALGALLIGSTLSNWLSRFASWIKGNQTDDTVVEVENNSYALGELQMQIVSLPSSTINISGFSLQYPVKYENFETGTSIMYYDEDYSVYLTCTDKNGYRAVINFVVNGTNVKTGIVLAPETNSPQNSMIRKIGVCYNTNPEGYCVVTDSYALTGVNVSYGHAYKREGQYNIGDLAKPEIVDSSVSQKTETVVIPSEITNNYFYTINPDVQTTTQDQNNVPVPLSAEQIADAVWNKIVLNTDGYTAYQPTISSAADGFSDQDDINTDDYDEPLPEPDPEPQPDWDSMNAGDVPAFTQSVWNYFMQNHNWQQLKQKFPFSLPYDAYLIASIFFDTSYDVMDELPQDGNNNRLVRSSTAPVYTLSIPWGYGDPYTLVLDFSLLDPWQPILRAAAGVLFTVALIVGVL